LLKLTGQWEEVAYHPRETFWRAHESRKLGPDSLQRHKTSGKLCYFEFKWGWNWELTHHAAEFQAMKYLMAHPRYRSEKIAGAYMGILQWNIASDRFESHLIRVWPPDQQDRNH
jgi:hypothetical protein